MKKGIAIVLAVVMMIGIVPISYAAGGVDISLAVTSKSNDFISEENSGMLKTGNEFDVAIVLGNDSHVQSGKVEIDYDADSFEYLGYTQDVEDEDGSYIVNGSKTGRVICAFARTSELTEQTSIITAKFSVKPDAKGRNELKLVVTELLNHDGAELSYTAKNANVNIYHTVSFIGFDNKVIDVQKVVRGDDAKAPSAPYVEGYTFTGWDKAFTSVMEELTVKAQYKINTYTVKFVDWDGTTLKEETVEYGKSATAPENPTREGYNFKGWDKDFSSVKENMTVTAVYEEATEVHTMYTVTFVDGITGEVIKTQQVEEGKAAEAPEAPIHEGYKFTGWDKDFTEVKENMTVTAMYELEQGIVRGDANEDGIVDSSDATTVLRFVAHLEDLSDSAKLNADANEDQIVDSADATSILRFVAKLGW